MKVASIGECMVELSDDGAGRFSRGFGGDTRNTALYLFAQDSYKLKPNLTLNYGLRWELNTPYYDTGNRLQTFRPGQATTQYPCFLSAANAAALGLKDRLRRVGVLRVWALQWPVISVGSVSAGGAGKTPVVIALVQLLHEAGWTVDVLSRGYGREGRGVGRAAKRSSSSSSGGAVRVAD